MVVGAVCDGGGGCVGRSWIKNNGWCLDKKIGRNDIKCGGRVSLLMIQYIWIWNMRDRKG